MPLKGGFLYDVARNANDSMPSNQSGEGDIRKALIEADFGPEHTDTWGHSADSFIAMISSS